MKVLFFGTPQIAVPFLEWLHANHEVTAVVCRQDEPVGRGYKLTAPPTKTAAIINNIPVFQPTGKWTEEQIKFLKDTQSDVGIAVAYGRIVPEAVFTAPKNHTLNIHFSLLPQYRGAGPMQWSLINGDKETGVTCFWIQKEMDAGPIFRMEKLSIAPDDNAVTLKEKLIQLGIKVLEKVMIDLENGIITKEEQKGGPTLAPMLKKEDGRIDWTQPAAKIKSLIAGVVEWPGAQAHYKLNDEVKQVKIFKVQAENNLSNKAPGEIIEVRKNEGIVVQTGSGQLLIQEIQPQGKKVMPAPAFWNGAHLKIGDKFF